MTPSREARVSLRFATGDRVECTIDTGFDGEVMLPRSLVESLGLAIVGQEEFEMVGSHFLIADISLVELFWLGERRTVEAIVSEGDDALIGTDMLAGTQLRIDYVAGDVAITSSR